MKGIIIASHGKMAEGIIDTVKLFFGDPKQLSALCIAGDGSPDEFYPLMGKEINTQNTGQGVIVMCDILFGTPCNCVTKLLEQFGDDLDVITGVNLPMILQVLADRESDAVDLNKICQQGIDGIKNLKSVLQETTDDDDD